MTNTKTRPWLGVLDWQSSCVWVRRKPPLTMPFLYPSSKALRPHPEGSMARPPNHWAGWAYSCTDVLLTEPGFYDITSSCSTAHKVPGLSHGCVGEDTFLHRPQTKPSVCSAPQPQNAHLPAAGGRGRGSRGRTREGGRQSVNEWMLLTLLFGKNDRFKTRNADQLHLYFSKQGRCGGGGGCA